MNGRCSKQKYILNDGGKMLLALKRYALPLVLSACLYTLTYIVCGAQTEFWNVGIVVAVLHAYSLRFVDDIVDYQHDVEKRKALVPKPLLWALLAVASFVSVVLAVAFQLFWMLLPTLLVATILFAQNILQKCLKMLFIPSVVLALAQSLFAINWWLCAVVVVAIVVDGILVFKGENK